MSHDFTLKITFRQPSTAVETDSIAESMTEEEQIELALRMSLAENEEKEEENNDDMKE